MNENKKGRRADGDCGANATPQAAGRDESGRFVKGNGGGPGNPFARQTAAYRKALRELVTEKDIMELGAMLLMKAKGGDLAATKLLLTYCVGKPAEAVDPDRLDVEEWKLWQEGSAGEELGDVMHQLPAEAALVLLRAVMPHIGQGLLEQLVAEFPESKAKARAEAKAAREERKRAAEEGAKPQMTNGGNGASGRPTVGAGGPVGRPGHSAGRPGHSEDKEWLEEVGRRRPAVMANGENGGGSRTAKPQAAEGGGLGGVARRAAEMLQAGLKANGRNGGPPSGNGRNGKGHGGGR